MKKVLSIIYIVLFCCLLIGGLIWKLGLWKCIGVISVSFIGFLAVILLGFCIENLFFSK